MPTGSMKVSKITRSARGEQCQLRLPGVCKWGPDTVVAAHRNGGGIAAKHPDSEICYACSACHDVYDRRVQKNPRGTEWDWEYVDAAFDQGSVRTRAILIDKGLLKLS